MSHLRAALALALTLTLIGSASRADNDNVLQIVGPLAPDTIRIVQEGSDLRLRVEVASPASLSPAGSWRGASAPVALSPGVVRQVGSDLRLDVSILGADTLFAAVQEGRGHRASATIIGAGNQAEIHQSGAGQIAAIRQTGTNNSVFIRQASW